MAFHKRVKFPFEVTKGKAADLFKLKFMRKSEFDPTLRHTLKYNVRQMGKQLDIWYKEQSFTLGSLSKEQDKLYLSRKRLKVEQRRIKKRDYAEYQEEIRQKLYGIREKMMMMKVVQKFRDNVVKNKHQRLQEVEAKAAAKRATANATGTSSFIKSKSNTTTSDASFKTSAGDVTDVDDAADDDPLTNKANKKARTKRDRQEKCAATNITKSIADSSQANYGHADHSDKDVTKMKNSGTDNSSFVAYRSDNENDSEDDDEVEGTGIDFSASFGQRYPSSHGARMETIVEEIGEEVEVNMDDDTNTKDHVRLTRQRLRQFNRSHSKKNIFAESQQVPLLPDVRLVSIPSPVTVRESVDKGTQTSNTSKRPRKKDPRDKVKGKAKTKLIVKLPGHYEAPTTSDRSNYGSDSDSDVQFEDNGDTGYGDDDTDEFYGGVVSNTGIHSDISGTGGYESSSELSDDSLDEVFVNKHVKNTLELNSGEKGEKGEHVTSTLHHKHYVSEEVKLCELPSLRGIKLQNPYNLEYKERSFFIKPNSDEHRTIGSARTERSCDQNREFIHSRQKRRTNNQETQNLEDIKNKRVTEIKAKMTREYVKMNISSDVDIAVFGKKANSFLKKRNITPPNTPNVAALSEAAKRSPRGHAKVATINKKREQSLEREKLHQLVCSEPVQKYERTRSGRLLPMGPPRVSSHDRLPTMKDRYYREKLLKAERDTAVSQNIKMKKFMDLFDKERDPLKLPPIAGSSSARTDTGATGNTGKAFSNIVFKVYKPEQDLDDSKKILTPEVSNSSVSMLRNCRYLREYRPAMGAVEKETSWKMKSAGSAYKNHYIPQVRLLHLN